LIFRRFSRLPLIAFHAIFAARAPARCAAKSAAPRLPQAQRQRDAPPAARA
jgi:hypothetical protein